MTRPLPFPPEALHLPPGIGENLLRNFRGRVRWYGIEGGAEGEPQVGELTGPREEGLWWSGWRHLVVGYTPDPHLLLHDPVGGHLSIRATGYGDSSEELYRDSDWPTGYRVARRVALPIGDVAQYLFHDPDTGQLDLVEVTRAGQRVTVRRRRRWHDRSLVGWSDAVAVTRSSTDQQATHLLLLRPDRTGLEVRRFSDVTHRVATVRFGSRAERLVVGWYDANGGGDTGDDLLVQLLPTTHEEPAAHVLRVYVQDGDDGYAPAANTLVGRPFTSLTTAPLTIGGRSELVALDRERGDLTVFDTDADGRPFVIDLHRGIAPGWEQVVYVPDLSGQDAYGQPLRSLLLYRSS
ncbi:hypothetical protein ACQEVB_34970 [Pseudonocardia sp. CA-107938]|uniref:hypothetical protein n=1 Tax=Pseudonocardia sp. CA-107938 TaxID=3240021 RepID=UPI003D9157FE